MATHADGALSNVYQTHALCKHGQRITVVAYCCGVLHSAKRAKMYGFCDTDACPLCGQPDGGSHIASGCQHNTMTRLYTERHNKAGRMVLSCISKGSMAQQTWAETKMLGRRGPSNGDQPRARMAVATPHPTATPTLKKEHRHALQLLKPDILLVTGDRTRHAAVNSQIYIVEIKT
jgi:hypothetical protein